MIRFVITVLSGFLFVHAMNAQTNTQLLHDLESLYGEFVVSGITERRFTQEELLRWIEPAVTDGIVTAEEVGRSGEGRPLTLYTYGSGPTSVFLWSQMHGDEATATMAIADILSFLRIHNNHPVAQRIREQVTVFMLPMLNPDGARRFQRRTSNNIDINRDALRLATPEARALKEVRDRINPAFGFNLHDQNPRYTAGTSGKMAAIALLAPATETSRSYNEVRSRARLLASSIADMLSGVIPGQIARWDDTFEPRAFGDNIQKWGTSTVLIESGGWPGDPEKMYLRKLNTLALLWSFLVIGDASYAQSDTMSYENLPFNMDRGFDLLVQNGLTRDERSGEVVQIDVGLDLEETFDDSARTVSRSWSVEDIGDLSTYTAFERIDLRGEMVPAELLELERKIAPEKLKSLIPLK